ncbi:MAG: hypothetical protein HFI92_03940 [Lachnospiraceae bacterium]|nr:hypothetical protein [Lachnospiraceae bacterium]
MVPLASTKLPNMVFHIPGMIAGCVWMVIGVLDLIRVLTNKEGKEEVER